VVGFLLLAAVGSYTFLATTIFRQEKVALLYDINHNVAVNAAAQLRASLQQTSEKVKLYLVSEILAPQTGIRVAAKDLKDAHIRGLRLLRKDGDTFVEDAVKLETPIADLTLETLLPFAKEAETNGFAFWRTNGADDNARFFLATKIEVVMGDKTPMYIAFAELDGKPFFETLQAANLFKSYLIKKNGDVLLHADRNEILGLPNAKAHPLLETVGKKDSTPTGVSAFDYLGKSWYGAYAAVGLDDLYFFSQAGREEVDAALETLLQRSLLYGLIAITVTFLVSILLSRKLTRGIHVLSEGARQIGSGDLKSHIDVRSGDEVEQLAHSFNEMMDALRASREEIEKYNQELEAKVELRTKQLRETNATIKEVQEKLISATQLAAVGEMAGRTAHEVLNPLTAILSRIERSVGVLSPVPGATLPGQLGEILRAWESEYSQGGFDRLKHSLAVPSQVLPRATLFEEDLDNLKKLTEYWDQEQKVLTSDLSFVRQQAERIQRIVDQMRELVRSSSSKSEVRCHDALREAMATMADFLSKNNVRVVEKLEASEDISIVNRDELIQIVLNLMRNSYQAITSRESSEALPQGVITLRTEKDGESLIIDVIDNGVGVAEENQVKLFDQGFTTKPPSEGTGLGLAICRRYARAFGGDVTLFFSHPGQKTCFRIRLPLAGEKVTGEFVQPTAPPPLSVDPLSKPVSELRITEDDEDVRQD